MEDEADTVSFLDGLISPDTRRRTREQTQPFVDVLCSPLCIRTSIITVGTVLLILSILLVSISLSRSDSEGAESGGGGGGDYAEKMEQRSAPAWMLGQVTDTLMRTHLQALSSDLMEGRGTGTRGEALAVQYITSHFAAAGLQPVSVGGGSPNASSTTTTTTSPYHQSVPLAGVSPVQVNSPLVLGPLTLPYVTNFTASTDLLLPITPNNTTTTTTNNNNANNNNNVTITDAQVVFVGYGIVAPAFAWDDYKDADVTGKVVLSLVNEPHDDTNSEFFAGDTLTYYGRWTYKFEQARAKGALAVILIHTDQSAGYGWQVVANSFAGEQVMLADSGMTNPLHFKGWINEASAQSLASLHGSSLAGWVEAANKPTFTPITLNTRCSVSVSYKSRYFTGTNVVARLGPQTATTETVVMVAHHDHLGIRPASPGTNSSDDIYNGAVDNASGVAALLSAAYALGALYRSQPVVAPDLQPKPPNRAIIFLSATGEESNLLGSLYFTKHTPCDTPLCGAISALNFDVMNVWGACSNVVVIGYGMSKDMDAIITESAKEEQMSVVPDPTPQLGHLFRSDQLPFALAHVPSVSLSAGTNYTGQDPTYYQTVSEEYVAEHYHQPSDQYDPNWSMDGIIQQTRIMLRAAYRLANAPDRPKIENSGLLPPSI